MIKKRKFLLLLLTICLAETAFGQHPTYSIRGVVTDDSGRGIELATVSLNQAFVTGTGSGGKFELKNVPAGSYNYRVSFVGFETVTGTLTVKTGKEVLNVRLHELGLQLKNVVVTAKQVLMGSKSVIDQDAIRHIQPKSIGDLLQLVPGNLTENPNLNNLSQAHIREIENYNSDNSLVSYNANNTMGTAVVVDGIPLTNDGNMQVLNTTKYGNLSGDNSLRVSANTTAGQGIDLRTVGAGNVESMEVVRGIPSVEYGNLTSGVVIVNTKSGHTPWEAKLQADPNSKLVFVGKGFNLPGSGAVNFAVDWAQSWADTRIQYKGYDRVTASAGYSNKFGPVTFNVRGAFFSSINDTKQDAQMTEEDSYWKNSLVGGRLAINGRYTGDHSFITSLDYKFSGQWSRQYDWMNNWVVNADGVITDTRKEGLQTARFKRYGYHSEYEIESIPVNIFAQVVANKYMRLNDHDHTTVKVGAEYTYSGNRGDGMTYDTENPPQAQSSQTLRPRAYSDVPGMSALSAFISDRTSLTLGTMNAQVEAGVRLSNTFLDKEKSGGNSGYFVAEPRVNASLSVLNRRNNHLVDDLSITGGYGLSNKLPTMVYLYPDRAYYDHVALARWNENDPGDRLAVVQTTIVSQTQNPDLKPANSRKWELGLSARKGQWNATVTYFNEHHDNEYSFATQLLWIDYPSFSLPGGVSNPAYNGETQQVTYTAADGTPGTAVRNTYTERTGWSMSSNAYETRKHGIEYTLGLGEWPALRTSLNISGAWFWIKRLRKNVAYENVNYNTRMPSANQYCIVSPAGAGSVKERVSTNFAFITHIPAVKMIFTTNVQVVWRNSSLNVYEDADGNSRFYQKSYDDRDYMVADPLGYYDMEQNWHPWTAADAENPMLNSYMNRVQLFDLEAEVDKPWVMLSMRLTKEIGKTAELSFIANNLTNTRKYRRYANSNTQYQVYPPMYFGGEVKLKF